MKKINLIAAVDEQFGFGKDGKIPWHHPEDFKYFQNTTKDQTVIMGRATYEDLLTYVKKNKFLPGRDCIVVTSRELIHNFPNVYTASNISDALNVARTLQGDIFFIGGESIFEAGLNMADCVYLTFIPGIYGCDRFFPFNKLKQNYQIYNKWDGESGLRFHIYVHNIWGSHNL